MRGIVACLGMLLALGTASAQTIVDDPDRSFPRPTFDVVVRAFSDGTYDPISLQFRNLRREGEIICGEVNGRNLFGAYTGFRPFGTDIKQTALALQPFQGERETGASSFAKGAAGNQLLRSIADTCQVPL